VSEGVFQTDREIFNNPVWKNVLKFRLFFYIYGNAVYLESGKDYGGIHINRGQFLKSYRKLQEGLEYIENHAVKQYSLYQSSRAVDELVEERRVEKTDTELGTLFTVCNYEEYQGFERFKEDSIEQRKNTDGTLMEQMRNNNKKVKKEKKEDIYTQIFETAYKNHPRPQAKADTFKNWNSLLTTHTEEQLLQFAENYKSYFESIPETDRPFAYSSNNFYGRKAYYLDFQEPKKWEGKSNGQQPPSKYRDMTNYKPGE
jgi:hypothetical protein